MTAGLKKYDIDPADLDPNGIAENQTTAGAEDLTLDGTLCDAGTALQFDIGDGYSAGIGGIRLLFDSAGDISAITFTITGKDQDGNNITETVTGVSTTAVSTTKYYSQVTVIATSGAVGSNVFIGTVTGELMSRTIPLNSYSEIAAAVVVSGLTGTCQFRFQETFEDILVNGTAGAVWFNVLSNQSGDVSINAAVGATAVRLKLDSYSNGAELQFHVNYNPYR